MTKAELGEFIMRFLDSVAAEEEAEGGSITFQDAVIVTAFTLDGTDEDGEDQVHRGVMMRSTTRELYRTVGLLEQGLMLERHNAREN